MVRDSGSLNDVTWFVSCEWKGEDFEVSFPVDYWFYIQSALRFQRVEDGTPVSRRRWLNTSIRDRTLVWHTMTVMPCTNGNKEWSRALSYSYLQCSRKAVRYCISWEAYIIIRRILENPECLWLIITALSSASISHGVGWPQSIV